MREKDNIVTSVCDTLVSEGMIEAYAYDHFRESEAVPLPFAVYRRVAQNNFSADDKVYFRGGGVDLEIYASTPDEMTTIMTRAEALLDGNDIYYECTADTVYIESEDFYETLYEL